MQITTKERCPLSLLPIILTFLLVYLFYNRQGLGPRESMLAASVICGLAVVFITESLSALHQIDPFGLTLGWWILALMGALLLLKCKIRG